MGSVHALPDSLGLDVVKGVGRRVGLVVHPQPAPSFRDVSILMVELSKAQLSSPVMEPRHQAGVHITPGHVSILQILEYRSGHPFLVSPENLLFPRPGLETTRHPVPDLCTIIHDVMVGYVNKD